MYVETIHLKTTILANMCAKLTLRKRYRIKNVKIEHKQVKLA